MDAIVNEMDFDLLGSGEFTASPDEIRNAIGNEHVFFLDVRANASPKPSPAACWPRY